MEDLLAGAVFVLYLAAQLLAMIVVSRKPEAERAREAAGERGRPPAWALWHQPDPAGQKISRPV
jgi:hypothetical protein